MSRDAMLATADKLVEYCRTQQEARGLDELYHPDAVSVESVAQEGGGPRETVGIEGIRGKHVWWAENFEVHGGSVDGPHPHGDDRFALIFDMDATHRASGQRSKMHEIGVYTTDADGRIIREEFFYAM